MLEKGKTLLLPIDHLANEPDNGGQRFRK